MNRNKRYRIAVVGGAGSWGRRYMKAYAERSDCEIVALVDRARDRRQAFADHYGAGAVFDSLGELLAREVPDIVSVILPVSQSPDAVIACAEAGVKVVSCEKPIATSLQTADDMVRICRDRGTSLGCGTGHWDALYLAQTAQWIRDGHLGRVRSASLPQGLPNEVSGGGCVPITMLRLLTGMEMSWVEGWAMPVDPAWTVPTGASDVEIDGPAHGRMGLSGQTGRTVSGDDVVCDVPEPDADSRRRATISIRCNDGDVSFDGGDHPTIVRGRGATSTPVSPDFFNDPPKGMDFVGVIERLLIAFDTGEEAVCSGHDYRQALEVAIAFKLSHARNHGRVELPLKDRSARIFPQPYRLHGGDALGWDRTQYPVPKVL